MRFVGRGEVSVGIECDAGIRQGGWAISSGRWEAERGIGLIQVGTQGKDGGQ